jgi:hypothetical protein
MSTVSKRKVIDGPIRVKLKVASGYTPTVGDHVELTSNDLEVQAIADDTKSTKFVGEVFDDQADNNASYCIVELIGFQTYKTGVSHAAIAAPGPGVMKGQKVAAYNSGTDEVTEINCMIFETASGADENVAIAM